MSAEIVTEQISAMKSCAKSFNEETQIFDPHKTFATHASKFETDHFFKGNRRLQVIREEREIVEHNVSEIVLQTAEALSSHLLDYTNISSSESHDWHRLIYSISELSIQTRNNVRHVLFSQIVIPEPTRREIRPKKLVFNGEASSKTFAIMQQLNELNSTLDRIELSVLAVILEEKEKADNGLTIEDISSLTEYAPATIKGRAIPNLKRCLASIGFTLQKQSEKIMISEAS